MMVWSSQSLCVLMHIMLHRISMIQRSKSKDLSALLRTLPLHSLHSHQCVWQCVLPYTLAISMAGSHTYCQCVCSFWHSLLHSATIFNSNTVYLRVCVLVCILWISSDAVRRSDVSVSSSCSVGCFLQCYVLTLYHRIINSLHFVTISSVCNCVCALAVVDWYLWHSWHQQE